MNTIINFILSMIPYIFLAVLFTVIIRYIIYKKTNKLDIKYEINLIIFVGFITGLFSQTLKTGNESMINLIPFGIIGPTINNLIKYKYITPFLINILGNIIMFIPIGYFIPKLWKIDNKKVILIGFCISLFIEISQLFLNRTTDVDDLILNTLGTIIGLLIYKSIKKDN